MTLLHPYGFRPGPPRPAPARRASTCLTGQPERHVVPGRGAALIRIAQGDRIEVINQEGGQPAEILAAHADGRIDAGILGARADTPADGLRDLLASEERSLAQLRQGLAARGIGMHDAMGIGLFGQTSPAGDRADFAVLSDGWLVLAAPGAVMAPEGQDTSTSVIVNITRASPRETQGFHLPDPLADPILDLRVKSATAEAYLVRAGEYFQIIDIDGRQCTDFQCFDARKVDKGIYHPLDVTTTRTHLGHDYPIPGLFSQYFDHDDTTLVEVVQDTCGRHDAFAMACSAKYYDDIGYPGHANCSDNFNRALDPYGIPSRAGWMAANFFFNTAIDAHGVMYSDEPWSRPGDYVLLRALTDIICVSSACPDDTSPANGWNPTDIHVRSYAASERFSRAIAWRATPESDPVMTRETCFHSSFAAMTRDFVEYKGFWLPDSFPDCSPVESYYACRNDVVVMDLSPLRKFEVTGPDSEALMNWILTRDVSRLTKGQVVYSAMCHPHGGMIDDGTLFRLGEQNFRWIGGSDEAGTWMREEAGRLGLNVLIRSSTDQMHNLAVQGPKSCDLVADIIWTRPTEPTIEELGRFRFAIGRIGGPNGAPVVVSRTGYTGETGYEIFCHPKDGKVVFEAVWQAGQTLGLKPMGLAGLDLVRIEAGLIFAGYDFDDQTDPFEAGIGFAVPLESKVADFVGREALIRRKAHPSRKFVGLLVDGQEPVAHGDGIYLGRPQIGEICSTMRVPDTGQIIALARVDVTCAAPGTEVEIGRLDGRQKRIAARIASSTNYLASRSHCD